jgi:tRNA dimethylallyltransferase
MMRNRLVEEITNLLIKYPKESPAFDAIGYKEVIECLDGNITLEECLFLIQKNSRNYAKRQLTWF